jgi:hypothetical protein
VSKAFVVRYEMRPDSADENQRLVENVFAELAEKQPDGLQYACFRLADGESFVHVAISSDDSNVLGETAAFQEFQKAFAERAAGKPVASGATLVGMYGFDR